MLMDLLGLHDDLGHHSTVFMIQNVAMVDKRACDIRVAEIHADSDIWERPAAEPGRNNNRIH